jgi:putative transposase
VPFSYQEVGIDGHKKINDRKRHLLVDTLGLVHGVVVHGVVVHAANHHGSPQGAQLVERFFYTTDRLKSIIADSAYRGSFVKAMEALFNKEVDVQITSQNKKSKNFEVIPKRWIVERTITWMNFFQAIGKRL